MRIKHTDPKISAPERPRKVFASPSRHYRILTAVFLFLSFFSLTVFLSLRIAKSSDFHYVSLLFDFLWSFFFSVLVFSVPRPAKRPVYAVLYLLLFGYGIAQIIYSTLFDSLFPITAVTNFGEGAGYFGSVFSCLTLSDVLLLVLQFCFAGFVFFLLGKIPTFVRKLFCLFLPGAFAVLLLGQFLLPGLYGKSVTQAVWNSFESPRFQYDTFSDPRRVMGLSGYYQYLCTDIRHCLAGVFGWGQEEEEKTASAFIDEYGHDHKDNDMTGIFRGKNLLLVMMESIDYPAIENGNTPAISYLMENGISFSDYYAPVFGNGATFSNEFCLNTGIFAPSDGHAAYAYAGNDFSESLPHLFRRAGYTADSFHENYGWFYDRSVMHQSFGYEGYHSFYDYGGTEDEVWKDPYAVKNRKLLRDLLPQDPDRPFFSFLITYSAHLAYTKDDAGALYANSYVKVDELPLAEQEDLAVLRAKARITDDLFAKLTEELDENTVLIAVADHYAYGLSEETLCAEKGEVWALRQRVPFFIYCKDPAFSPQTVKKVCSSLDFLPTVANLFGLGVPKNLSGHDIFDPSYEGYAVFSNYSWCCGGYYCHDGVLYPLTAKRFASDPLCYIPAKAYQLMQKMTAYTYSFIPANDALLACDFYKSE